MTAEPKNEETIGDVVRSIEPNVFTTAQASNAIEELKSHILGPHPGYPFSPLAIGSQRGPLPESTPASLSEVLANELEKDPCFLFDPANKERKGSVQAVVGNRSYAALMRSLERRYNEIARYFQIRGSFYVNGLSDGALFALTYEALMQSNIENHNTRLAHETEIKQKDERIEYLEKRLMGLKARI